METENFLKIANKYFFDKKYQLCIDMCNKGLESGRASPWLYARKGLSLYHLAQNNEAKEYLSKAILKGVKHAEVQFYYGLSLLKDNDTENEGRHLLKLILRDNPKYVFRNWELSHEQGKLKKKLDTRLYEVYKANNERYSELKKLLEKDYMNDFMKKAGYLVPKLYSTFPLGDAVTLDSLPTRFVIKPRDGFNSNGVFVIENGVDLFRRKKIPNEIGNFLLNYFGKSNLGKVLLVEELIDDVDLDTDPYLKIPRDFKVFVANGRAYWVNVYNRNARNNLRSMVSYNTEWKKVSQMTSAYLPGFVETKPKYFDEMLRQAEKISQKYPLFMRLDFYLSKVGPIFGEFTPFPGDFINATEFGVRTMNQMIEIFADGEENNGRE